MYTAKAVPAQFFSQGIPFSGRIITRAAVNNNRKNKRNPYDASYSLAGQSSP